MVEFKMIGLGSIQAYPRTHYKPAIVFMFRTSPVVKDGEIVDFRQISVEESNLDGLEELGKMLLTFVEERRKKKATDLAKVKEPPVPDPRKAANREEEAGENGGGGT
jgi:hypothetical protein